MENQLHLEITLPKYVDSWDKFVSWLEKRFGLCAGSLDGDETQEDLFWDDDMRSFCGFIFDTGEILLFPEYYSKFCPDGYAKLRKISTVIPD